MGRGFRERTKIASVAKANERFVTLVVYAEDEEGTTATANHQLWMAARKQEWSIVCPRTNARPGTQALRTRPEAHSPPPPTPPDPIPPRHAPAALSDASDDTADCPGPQ